ncbi:MAG: SDR family NAD(P)-dependent oxidoreductase, partial [Bradyrhizobium sp.]
MSKDRLKGKRCIITAAAAGIGRATAIEFAQQGASVLATDVDRSGLETLSAEWPSIRTEYLDVTDKESIDELIRQQDQVDVLFNCAGYVHAGTILETGQNDWRRSFDINVDAMFHLCQAAIPRMLL